MEKSISIKEIAIALGKFQATVPPVLKKGKNPYFRSNYATLDDILETVRKPLEDNGISFSQFPSGENSLTTIIMHISGEYLQSTIKMAPKDETPQGQGSAITYMRRYALSAVLGIATEDDDDGNTASTRSEIQKVASKSTSAIKPLVMADKELPPPPKPVSLKVKINHLLGLLNFDTQFSTPEDTRAEIFELTKLEAIEENYPEIFQRLEIVVKEKQQVDKDIRNSDQ